VAVLERQRHAEVPFQRAPDGVAGQRPQQLAAGLLVRRRQVVDEPRSLPGNSPRSPAIRP
jgi:hypothetical protein